MTFVLPTPTPPAGMPLRGRRVAVFGMGKSGLAGAEFLTRHGVEVVVIDERRAGELKEPLRRLEALRVQALPAVKTFEQLGDPDLLVVSPGVSVDHPLLIRARQHRVEAIGEIDPWGRAHSLPPILVLASVELAAKSFTTEASRVSRPIVLLLLGLLSLPGLAVAAGGELGPELLTNGGMEEDSGWVSANSGSATLPRVNEQSAADKHSGAFSRYALISRATTNEWPGVSSPNFTTQTGQTLQIRFWYKVLRGSFTLLARNGENNNQVGPQPAAPFAPRFDPTGKLLVWSEYVGTYTERGGGAGAYLRFIISSSSDVEFFLDDVSVRAVDASPAAALRQWRARYPNRTLICWQKSPWTNLDQVEFPPAEPQECRALSLSMGRSEYESASFVLTNLSDQPLTVPVSVKPSLLTVTLRQAVWVTEVDGATCNDALPLLEGPLTIPSGGSREVWLTLQTRGSKPGDLRTAVEIDREPRGQARARLRAGRRGEDRGGGPGAHGRGAAGEYRRHGPRGGRPGARPRAPHRQRGPQDQPRQHLRHRRCDAGHRPGPLGLP